MGALAAPDNGLVIGRYVVFDEIAAGGMATVHLGRQRGAVGFARTVAIKRLHPNLSRDEEFVTMFLDEARLAARIEHPNVVRVMDVVRESGELFLVMEYVQGESLARLIRAARPGVVPLRVAVAIVAGMLHGLHAAHEATAEGGQPLHIVHRDVSPQNVLVGIDGLARVFDFGVAKAANRAQTTRDGAIKGKISYMAPEQLLSESIDRRADVYAAAVVLWEALTGERLFDADNQGRLVRKILDEPIPLPSSKVPGLPAPLDEAVMRGLDRDPSKRFPTARELAIALERSMPIAPATETGEWVASIAGSSLDERAKRVKAIESRSETRDTPTPDSHEKPTVVPPARKHEEVPSERSTAGSPTRQNEEALSSTVQALKVPSPFAPVPVQTIAVAPLASLDPVRIEMPPSSRDQNRRSNRVVLWVVAVIAVLAAAVALTTLLRR